MIRPSEKDEGKYGRMYKKLISIVLVLSMICGWTVPVVADENEPAPVVDETKLARTVYIHASESDPEKNPPSYTQIYAGEDVNVYAAIDAPNKGKKNEDGTFDEEDYQYNLNSYIVKFYFDPNYFDLVYHDIKTHKNPSLSKGSNQSAINYMLPFQTKGMTFEDAETYGVGTWDENEIPEVVVDYTDRTLQDVTVQDIYGKNMRSCRACLSSAAKRCSFPSRRPPT